MDRAERFWDRFAAKYAAKPVDEPDAYEIKLAKTRQYFTPETQVLEFGCGTGTTAVTHAPYVHRIVAVDISQKMVDICKENAKRAEVENVEFLKGTLFDVPETFGSFDVVLGLSILHLVDDLDAHIQKVHGLLKPGGIFVSNSACIAQVNWLMKLFFPVGAALGLLPELNAFDAQTLTGSLQKAGFTIIEDLTLNKGELTHFIIAKK
ncbi:MAG TPA: SAM-dependent methyltransferase [Myxococcales bacterium]|nr:SAM-dependent methyltransferase [Deltaproteobacteria bacterium]MBU47436.1 SAM-dependent methyltransferase [Deltaproteobacteria bacterium]HAA55204.1 SAM-dependent methyltransferase [Myxococcales bacterium]|tara:strand:+ start:27257 stop:27877 length:621 start_codon:yes stop_codon:yes gene_type:complete